MDFGKMDSGNRETAAQESLLAQLQAYAQSNAYPLHMPGHKRIFADWTFDPYGIDITEIDGFDNLHHAEGILLAAQQRAAALYGAEETFYLVNGSTAGILAAVSACAAACRSGGAAGEPVIVMARNCHKSAFHAVYLNRLRTAWVYPRPYTAQDMGNAGDAAPEKTSGGGPEETGINGRVSPSDIAAALERITAEGAAVCAVLITSPTYDGVVSDVAQIARTAHRYHVPLIVDEAHGAHFGMHPDLPRSSVNCGADLVIHSLHKTLPSLTQTALLHVCGQLADRGLVRRFLDVYQTSSPSYVFMAAMDRCIRTMAEKKESLFDRLLTRLCVFREKMQALQTLRLIETDDPTRILVFTDQSGLTGAQLAGVLRTAYQLEVEMVAPEYILAIMTVADTQEGIDRFAQALLETDRLLTKQKCCSTYRAGAAGMPAAEEDGGGTRLRPDEGWNREHCGCLRLDEAWDHQKRRVPLEQCAGCISAEFVYLYPPGIPLLIPGEMITKEICGRLLSYRERGYSLQGMDNYEMTSILICDTIGEAATASAEICE